MGDGIRRTQRGSSTRTAPSIIRVSYSYGRDSEGGLMEVAFKFIFCIWALGRADKYLRGEPVH